MVNKFLSDNYNEIVTMAKKICKSHPESEEVAHYVISEFIEHKRAEELIEKGQAFKFMSGMIHRSFHSSTSPYHTIYRQKNRVHGNGFNDNHKQETEEYDYDTDLVLEAIEGILEDMQADNIEAWYRSTLFRMWLVEPNFSEISRQTGIPRTSISQAVEECKKYIRKTLHDRGIDYNY